MVATTLVGSFPLEYSKANIRRALQDQAELGITYPVLPQLRDFVYIYLEPLITKGVVIPEKRGYVLYRDFEEIEPETPEDILTASDIAREMGLKYRVPITGPFTLASKIALSMDKAGDISGSILTDNHYLDKIVSYVVRLSRNIYREVRGEVYCIDEPVLAIIIGSRSTMYNLDLEYIRDSIDRVLGQLGGSLRGIHVCGRLPPLVKPVLLGLRNAEFLDHEHSDFPANRVFYTSEELSVHSKKLAYGVISPSKPELEDFRNVLQLAREAKERYGDSLLFLKPDCGFGGLRGVLNGREYEEIVLKKIKILVQVAGELA